MLNRLHSAATKASMRQIKNNIGTHGTLGSDMNGKTEKLLCTFKFCHLCFLQKSDAKMSSAGLPLRNIPIHRQQQSMGKIHIKFSERTEQPSPLKRTSVRILFAQQKLKESGTAQYSNSKLFCNTATAPRALRKCHERVS